MLVFSWERYSKDGASLLVTDQRVDRHGSINSKGLLHNDAWGLSYYPREMAIDAGLYDLDFNGHWGKDDAEFADRVRHAGYNIWWIPEIKFKHLEHDLASWQYPDQDKDRNNSVLRDKSNMPGHQVNTGDLSNLFWVYEP